jgi:serine/threonine protein kinase
MARFGREKHPNIVNVRTVDLFNGSLFLALEFIPPNEMGVNTLQKQLQVAAPTLSQAVRWAISEGMIYARSKGLIAHRDLKPSNLMIDATNSIKITDFGLAIFAVDPSSAFVNKSPAGTPVYMAPEQFSVGTRIAETGDIYSFGIILFEMLTGGMLPFKVQYAPSEDHFTYFKRLHVTFELPQFNSPLYPLIARCLAKNPDDRYESFDAISKELKTIYKSLTGRDHSLISREEMDATEHTNFAVSYSMLGDNKRALTHIEQAIAAAPSYMQAHNNKAGILADLGRSGEAIKIWNELTIKAPTLGRPHYNLGNVAMQKGQFGDAIEKYRRAIEREPDYVSAIVNLAICHQNIGQYDEAIRLYDQSLKISPNDAQIIYNKAYALYACGKYADAQLLFSEVIAKNPRHVSAYNYLGLLQQGLNHQEAALSFFEKALAIDPTYSHAQKNKNMVLQSLKRKH